MKVAVLGAGAGAAATAVDLVARRHRVVLWSRSEETLAPFRSLGGIGFEDVAGAGVAKPVAMTADMKEAVADADLAVVALPTYSHGAVARALAAAGWPASKPVVLNPGHTGGVLEFAEAWRAAGREPPPLAELSTLTYVARKYAPDRVTISGRTKQVRVAALPGGNAALAAARELFSDVIVMSDVLATGLANVNMVLHPPGAVLAAAWVEATGGDFTFYVEGMTDGVARTMHALDDERRAVARAFGHDLPNLVAEMKLIGTVEADVDDIDDFRAAIVSGVANRKIKAPDSLAHRYYREDFGHGLLPFVELASIAGVAIPLASSLLTLAAALTGIDYHVAGRTAATMGIAGMSKDRLLSHVRHG
jgi:opine dehydrogenase